MIAFSAFFFALSSATLLGASGVLLYAYRKIYRLRCQGIITAIIMAYVAFLYGWSALATAGVVPLEGALRNGLLVSSGTTLLALAIAYHVVIQVIYAGNKS